MCTDIVPPALNTPEFAGFSQWVDSTGWSCEKYAEVGQAAVPVDWCARRGAFHRHMGYVANEVCCVCTGNVTVKNVLTKPVDVAVFQGAITPEIKLGKVRLSMGL